MGSAGDGIEGVIDDLVKPRVDTCDYKFVTLSCGLEALLISDPEADKAAAAADVRVGSMNDPDDIPGLAHFCEHMLFYSSEKYPKEDEYMQFINDHGGSTNAFTAAEDTCYYFDVNPDNLEPALDRFAQFFLCPLISKEGVQREMNAVDSEHSKNLSSDVWRNHQVMKANGNPQHPYNRFFAGNLETLSSAPRAKGRDVHRAVKDFHAQLYSANNTKLVVYGRQPVAELLQMVLDKFGGLEGQLVKVRPVRFGHEVRLTWVLPSTTHLYRTAPDQLLSHLLGHEAEGSAFALLKQKGWAASLSTGCYAVVSSADRLTCNVELTKEGNANVMDVVAIVFAYLDMLRGSSGEVLQQHWEEARRLRQLAFQFRERPVPSSYAYSLALSMQLYPPQELLLAHYDVPQEYDEECIRSLLAQLLPERVQLLWCSESFEADVLDHQEPWYGAQYAAETLPEEWRAAWSAADPTRWSQLHLPKANPFIPDQLDMQDMPEAAQKGKQEPRQVHCSEHVSLWHCPDGSFNLPKAVFILKVLLPRAGVDPESHVSAQLLGKLLKDDLNELTYLANLAGLNFTVRMDGLHLELRVRGYNDKLRRLLDTILDRLLSFEPATERFEAVLETMAKDLANYKYWQPYQLAFQAGAHAMNQSRWHERQLAEAAERIELERFRAFAKHLLGKAGVEGLLLGNVVQAEAEDLGQHLERLLRDRLRAAPPALQDWPEPRTVRLPEGSAHALQCCHPNPAEENAAVVVSCFADAQDDVVSAALADLVVHIGKQHAFYQLRTVEQLGYIVFMLTLHRHGVPCIALLVQGNVKCSSYMDVRVQEFAQTLLRKLQALTPQELQHALQELSTAKLERPKTLREKAAIYMGEISAGTQLFDRPEREVEALGKLTVDQVSTFAQRVLVDPATRRRLAVQYNSPAGPKPDATPPQPNSDAAADANGLAALGPTPSSRRWPPEHRVERTYQSMQGSIFMHAHRWPLHKERTMQLVDGLPEQHPIACETGGCTASEAVASVKAEMITDAVDFRRRMPLYPVLSSVAKLKRASAAAACHN